MPYPKTSSWQMFDRIAKRYDLLNRVLSLGIDQSWRKYLVKQSPKGATRVIDLATGTGDVLFAFERYYAGSPDLIGYDLSSGMIAQGHLKCQQFGSRVVLHVADAAAIPEASNSADIVSMSFGIRNVPDVARVLTEIYRLLKPSGNAMILEFTMPRFFLLGWLYKLYFRYVLPKIGGVVSGDLQAYTYLNRTVEDFADKETFVRFLQNAGFREVQAKSLTWGIATLYSGKK